MSDSLPTSMKGILMGYVLIAHSLYANPSGMETVFGTASASVQGSVLQVLASDNSIIHWDSFSIAPGEVTKFILPDPASAILNRVTGSQMSELMGSLQANGQIYLVNPQGVFVGADARIEAGSFVASTFDVLNEDFFARTAMLFEGDSNASIVNLGTISTPNGDVILLARHVENKGTIEALNGTAALAGGTHILLKPQGPRKVFIRASVLTREEESASIDNPGQIKALFVEMQADGNPYAAAIRHNGRIDALGVREEHGRVLLVAEGGRIDISGDIRASAAEIASIAEVETFGEICATAQELYVTDHAVLDVSNPNGGGKISLEAQCLVTTDETLIKADALERGDGGKVLMWGGDAHYFGSYVFAQGGPIGGNGGFVDASSAGAMKVFGLASTLAPQGLSGTLLFDPTNFVVSTGSDANYTISFNSSSNTYTFQDTANSGSAVINATTLQNNLALGNVSITTQSSAADSGDITVSSPFAWSAATTLTLFADRDIAINANVVGTGSASMNLTSVRDFLVGTGPSASIIGTADGAFNLTANRNLTIGSTTTGAGGSAIFTTGAGALNITTTNYYDGSSVITLNGSTSASSSAQILTQGNAHMTINAGGTLVLNGKGILATSSSPAQILATGSGSIEIHTATALNGGSVTSLSGSLTLTGSATGTSSGLASIQTTSGSINIDVRNATTGLILNGSATAGNGPAQVFSSSGLVTVMSDRNIQISSNSSTGSCLISGGTVSLMSDANITLTGGSQNITAGDAAAIVATTGNLSIQNDGSLTLTGSTVTSAANANVSISTLNVSAATTIQSGHIELVGGSGGAGSPQSNAFILCNGSLNLTSAGNLILRTTGTGLGGTQARIDAATSGSSANFLNITVGGSLFMTSSSSASAGTGFTAIQNFNGAPLTLSCGSDIYLTGGANSTSPAVIGVQSASNGGRIDVSANNILLTAGNAAAGANAYASIGHNSPTSVNTNTAAITVTAAGSLVIKGGTNVANSSFAQIGHTCADGGTLGGNISVTANQSICLSGTVNVAGFGASIGHGNGGISTASTYNAHTVNATAGRDFIFCSAGATGGQAAVVNFSSQVAGSIQLICDNNNSASPDYGAVAFFLGPNSMIKTGLAGNPGQVTIFTAVRIFNSNTTSTVNNPFYGGTTINGSAISTGTALATLGTTTTTGTITETWGVYSASPPAYTGGAGNVNIYYKRTGGIMINGHASAIANTPSFNTAVTLTSGAVNYPTNQPEIWLTPADIVGAQGLTAFNTTIDAQSLSPLVGSPFLNGNSILNFGSNGNVGWAGAFTYTQNAGNDITLASQISPSSASGTVTLVPGRDLVIGNGASAIFVSTTTGALTTQTMGFIPGASVPTCSITTGRDLLQLASLGTNSGAFLNTSQTSLLSLHIGRDYSLLASGSPASAGIASATGNTINCSVGRNLLQQAGSASVDCRAEIQSNTMTLDVTGQHTMIGGTGNTATTTTIVNYASLFGNNITHTVGTGLTMTGGTAGGSNQGIGASAVIAPQMANPSPAYSLTINHGDLTMKGGVGGLAFIQNQSSNATGGSITINIPNGNLSMNGADASILNGTNPTAGSLGSVNISNRNVVTTGSITLNVGGDFTMAGGAGNSCSANLQPVNALTAGPLNVTVNGNLTMAAGSGSSSSTLVTSNVHSTTVFEVGGNMTLQGGTGNSSSSQITSANPDSTIQSIQVTVGGNLQLLAGTAPGSSASLLAGTGNTGAGLTVTVGDADAHTGDIIMTANGGFNSKPVMKTPQGLLNILAHGNIVMTAAPASYGNSPFIGTTENGAAGGATVNNTIRVHADGNITLNSSGYNFCSIGNGGEVNNGGGSAVGTITGSITVTADGNIILNGASNGSYSPYMQLAQISTLTGLSTRLPANGGYAIIGHINLPAESFPTTFTGDITVNAQGSIVLNGGSSPSAFAQIGTGGMAKVGFLGSLTPPTDVYNPSILLAEAGTNISLNTNSGGPAQVVNYSTGSDSSISLVVDNDFPTPPAYGPGSFNMSPGSHILTSLTGGSNPLTPVQIYTSIREQNSMRGVTINGSAFIPGLVGVDTATEQWELWYPQTFGGFPFTIFYKHQLATLQQLSANGVAALLSANATMGQFLPRSGGGGSGGAGGVEESTENNEEGSGDNAGDNDKV